MSREMLFIDPPIEKAKTFLKAMECKGEETKPNSSITKLPLFSIPHRAMDSPERSGTLTPPIYAAVSVPFRWEEEPGKPRFSNVTTTTNTDTDTVTSPCLELPPRLLLMEKVARSEGSSFRMMGSDEMSSLFMKRRGWFGSWRRSKRDEVFPSLEWEVEASRLRRNGSFSSLIRTQIRPHFWVSVCEGLKHVVPSWRGKRLKKDV
ncbi:uncharacterized protein LOC111778333 isoform X2 [Cucurbita pepo subsp. pepo]|uniref:uncharacterized protein LOC111778333 isoform X2 n=1 Tax=Cucurbita pepo subsp. pepo TaxID=3664 RepID=UPI000C9D47EF|nr:uncharacterized protein LOC111778333 isoform X2 [Cucurbita pepo subsp. pepo]